MPIDDVPNGYLKIKSKPANEMELSEHGLFHGKNDEFFEAMLAVIQLLRAECLIRECHPIHEKLIELQNLIKLEPCQDFVPCHYPVF